ncbi:MAG: polysaccharide biosynthesis C-terminal domain-containing protein [Flavobacteriales bacterium]|nr:polysaccharide biosynthesis C-terminal domain-containing protein [Flavobacteriales bacterium]
MILRQVTGTLVTRVWTALAGMLVVMLAGHTLGAQGLGEMGLIVLGLSLIMLPVNVACGGAMVYLAPRYPRAALLRQAYLWALATAVVAVPVMWWSGLVPRPYALHVVGLALLQAAFTAHFGLLLGQQRIKALNAIAALQSLAQLGVFATLVLVLELRDAMAYVLASYASFTLSLALSAWVVYRAKARTPVLPAEGPLLRTTLHYGGFGQTANLLQLLTYRLSYLLVDHFKGTKALGVYSVGVQLSESAWLAPRSLAMVLYSKVTNTADAQVRKDLTLAIMKAAVASAVAVVSVLLVLPEELLQRLFGDEVVGLWPVFAWMAPGIVLASSSQAFAHYFSGIGIAHNNTVGSLLSLLVTAVMGWLTVPSHGAIGAAATATAAYLVGWLYQAFRFMQHTGTRPGELLPNAKDMRMLRSVVSRVKQRA